MGDSRKVSGCVRPVGRRRPGLEEAPAGVSHLFDLFIVWTLTALWMCSVPVLAVYILLVGSFFVLADIWLHRPGAW